MAEPARAAGSPSSTCVPSALRVGIVGSRPSGSEMHERFASRERVAREMTDECEAVPMRCERCCERRDAMRLLAVRLRPSVATTRSFTRSAICWSTMRGVALARTMTRTDTKPPGATAPESGAISTRPSVTSGCDASHWNSTAVAGSVLRSTTIEYVSARIGMRPKRSRSHESVATCDATCVS